MQEFLFYNVLVLTFLSGSQKTHNICFGAWFCDANTNRTKLAATLVSCQVISIDPGTAFQSFYIVLAKFHTMQISGPIAQLIASPTADLEASSNPGPAPYFHED